MLRPSVPCRQMPRMRPRCSSPAKSTWTTAARGRGLAILDAGRLHGGRPAPGPMPLPCRHPNDLAKLAAAYFAAPVLRPDACDRVPPHLERPALVVEDTLRPPDGLVHGDRLAFGRLGDPTR